jgi:hypothetical protein
MDVPSGGLETSPGAVKFLMEMFLKKIHDVETVLPIRIRIWNRIHIFLGLLDPDPFVRGMDPDPDPFIIKQK